MCRAKYWEATVVILATLSGSTALADEFKTINGKEYKNAEVSRVEPDGIVLRTKSGISKVYFPELPKEVQERFHYNAANAAQFTAATQEAMAQQNGAVAQQKGTLREKADTTRKNNEQLGKLQALQARYQELQQQEDDLWQRLKEMRSQPACVRGRSGSSYYSYPNPARADLGLLQPNTSRLSPKKAE